MKKTCYKCNTPKDLSEFYNAKTNNDGKQGQCKKCANEYQKQWSKVNPEKIKEYNDNRTKPEPLGERKKYSEKRTKDLQDIINGVKTAAQLGRELGVTRQGIMESIKHRGYKNIKTIKENVYNNKYKHIHKHMYISLQKTLIPYTRSLRFKEQHPEIWESYEKKYKTSIEQLRIIEYNTVMTILYKVGHTVLEIRKKYNIKDYATVWRWLNKCGIKSKTYLGRQVRNHKTKEIINQYVNKLKSVLDISKQYNVSGVLIYNILRENNIKMRKFNRPNSKYVIDKYINKQWAITKIYRHYNVSHGVIYCILRENNIKLRKKVDKLKNSTYVCTTKLNECITKSKQMTTKLNKEQRLAKIIGGTIPSNVLTYMRKNPRDVYKNLYSRSGSIFGPYTSKLPTRTLNRVNKKRATIKTGFRSLYTTEQLASFKASA